MWEGCSFGATKTAQRLLYGDTAPQKAVAAGLWRNPQAAYSLGLAGRTAVGANTSSCPSVAGQTRGQILIQGRQLHLNSQFVPLTCIQLRADILGTLLHIRPICPGAIANKVDTRNLW